MAEIANKCPLCRSEVVDGECTKTRKKNCPYTENLDDEE